MMSQVDELQRQAFEMHRTGRLADAEALYRRILAAAPAHAPALHLLGVLTFQTNRSDEALAHLQQAVAHDPTRALYYHALGEVYRARGEWSRAKDSFQQAVRLDGNLVAAHYGLGLVCEQQRDWSGTAAALGEVTRLRPDMAEVHAALANALQELGRLDEAIASFRAATRLQPDLLAAHYNLGNALHAAGRDEEAAASYREALRLAPDFAQAHNNLGMALQNLGNFTEAAAAFAHALRLMPDSAEAHHNLGTLMKLERKFDEARALLSRAVELDPGHAASHFNLGGTLFELREWDAARRCHLEALRLRPDYVEPHCSLGILCMAKGAYDEALGHFDRALAKCDETGQGEAKLAMAHHNRALLLLLLGDFARGWPEYDWRWKNEGAASRRMAGPAWDGHTLGGETVLLYNEQGLGDALQFIRYAPLVAARGGRVIVACSKRLIPILSTCPGIESFYASDDNRPVPPFTFQAALMDLPGIFHTALASIPAAVPYLSASREQVERWRERLGDGGTLRVGISWQGNPRYGWDAYRSIALAQFAPLAAVEGVRLVSLQQGFGREQLSGAPFSVEDVGSRLDADAAFCDTAAVIENLDLVVTSDTAVAHLAGALGAPVWVALPFGPDWRWLLARDDSPWYPTMRLFRQPRFADWPAVFERIAGELRKLVAAKRTSRGERPRDDA